ncbi:hypothetical protein Desaci_2329 [Desulfosporosinus acidiphilus SJ4]|uniref:DUF1634 domain-containing protein n=1 Tax=Desulfosporosinus acidiphilus (strain DSM 22704 / JCM 16185 / SJ4) TaxID=646529 RepID=I4D658_DESAJ|nr:hypothetical protein [Desulfosporosinus acidiphilus]AFM41282.1 hypothetical protein Desaci_2329 [Desulfosporosinus acidiphilus SJ4]
MGIQTGVTSATAKDAVNAQGNVLDNVKVSPEQNIYATILLICSWAGIIGMLITFIGYMAGAFSPIVKPSDMPQFWGMNVHQYLAATNAPSGWSWLGYINHGDYMNYVGLAFLGIVSTLGYVSLFINYLRKKDLTYTLMVSCEIIIIVLAASGIFHVAE